MIQTSQLVPALQVAVGPVILISGVGLLLLVETNRLGRTVDRLRALAPRAREDDRGHAREQSDILWRRSGILRTAITLAALSALQAAVLVLVLFYSALFSVSSGILLAVLFTGCLGCVIFSLVELLRDVNLSLRALRLEAGRP
jgi:hypothetical protein